MTDHADLERWLSLLEQQESPLLAWGDVDGAFTPGEFAGLVAAHDAAVSADEILDRLRWAGLVHDIDGDGTRFRTRAAETVRLLARLRQLFPRGDDSTGGWRGAPTLVRDFRFAVRPRRVPLRDQSATSVVDALRAVARPSQLRAVQALLDPEYSLAGFQVRAAEAILRDLRGNSTRAVVVTAGTGGGKTLSFYLPALAAAAASVNQHHWVKVLSVYPRNELLRDQLAAVFRMARGLDGHLAAESKRPLRIGALFQETPYQADAASLRRHGWKRRGAGFVCPFLACPECDARGEHGALIWSAEDIGQRERLRCDICPAEVTGDVFPLTRQSMASAPPDLMFASAEMLHRSTADLKYGKLVGVHADRPPLMLLMDEVHTYDGMGGAQTAQVVRRWRHLVSAPVVIVGLSATLPDPARFLSQLTGVDMARVTHVAVEDDEIQEVGAEYLLALRHDSAMATQVLSTTIQTLMCLARCLDPLDGKGPSGGLFGRRVFAFTDRLDVVNRLYSQMADAEARTVTGRYKSSRTALAALRNPFEPELSAGERLARRAAGQSWDFPAALDHDLRAGPGLLVGRVSSQDAGIDEDSSIVVATASLEVGFDDDRVGAVVQHGAPRDMAQFLQRRGRAGRPPRMRPWTVVVLSEYGRDRRSYQSWDGLFDPALPAKNLPVRNRYVVRMHAVHALLDWLAVRLRPTGAQLMLRMQLAEPPERRWADSWKERTAPVIVLLRKLLEDPATQQEFLTFVSRALAISESEAAAVLWHPPRPVLLGAVPTLLRRLETQWTDVSGGVDRFVPQVPLPDYVSRTLFDVLESPEVDVEVPNVPVEETETMNFETALREFPPGNSSRRFAYRTQNVTHWIPAAPPGPDASHTVIDVAAAYPLLDEVGTIEAGGRTLPLFQPLRLRLVTVPAALGDRATARPVWTTQLRMLGVPATVRLGSDGMASLIGELSFYLHADGAAVEVRRGVLGSEVEQSSDGVDRRFEARFAHEGREVAIGVRHEVDGMGFTVAGDGGLRDLIAADASLERAIRSAWFKHRVMADPALLGWANRFQLEWVHDAVLATLTTAVRNGAESLQGAADEIPSGRLLTDALDALLQRAGAPDDMDGAATARLRGRLEALAHDSSFTDALASLLPALWEPLSTEADSWLRERFRCTVGEAVLDAARALCAEHDPDGTVLQVQAALSDPGCPDVWLLERAPGGAGLLESLRRRIAEDPRAFLRLVRGALAPGETERADTDLHALFAADDGVDPAIASALQAYRDASGNIERTVALAALRQRLADRGIPPVHTTVASLVSRVARPGSGPVTDEALAVLLRKWREAEHVLGMEIDVRVWSHLGWEELRRSGTVLPGPPDEAAQLDAVASLLWPRGWEMRAAGLSSWNPFEEHPPSAPELVRAWVDRVEPSVDCGDAAALELVLEQLTRQGACRVHGAAGQARALAALVAKVSTQVVDVGSLLAYPRLAEIQTADGGLVAHLELREVW